MFNVVKQHQGLINRVEMIVNSLFLSGVLLIKWEGVAFKTRSGRVRPPRPRDGKIPRGGKAPRGSNLFGAGSGTVSLPRKLTGRRHGEETTPTGLIGDQ